MNVVFKEKNTNIYVSSPVPSTLTGSWKRSLKALQAIEQHIYQSDGPVRRVVVRVFRDLLL